jgi:hypothetical protein
MPPIPDVWLVKLGTNLKPTEILALEAAGFQLPLKKPVFPRRLFFSAPSPANLNAVPVPAEPDRYHGKRDSKIVKRTATRPNPVQRLSMAFSDSLKACIRSINMIPHPGHGCIIGLETQNPPTISQYQVTISSFVGCTCPAFKKTMTKVLREDPILLLQACVFHIFEGLQPSSRG